MRESLNSVEEAVWPQRSARQEASNTISGITVFEWSCCEAMVEERKVRPLLFKALKRRLSIGDSVEENDYRAGLSTYKRERQFRKAKT